MVTSMALVSGAASGVAYAAPAPSFHKPHPGLGKAVPARTAAGAATPTTPASSRSAPTAAANRPAAGSYTLNLPALAAGSSRTKLTPAARPRTGPWVAVGSSGVAVANATRSNASKKALARLGVRVLDVATARRYSASGLAVEIDPAAVAAPGMVGVRIPTSALDGVFGADYAARLRWAAQPASASTRPAGVITAVAAYSDPVTHSVLLTPTVTTRSVVLSPMGSPVAANGTGSFAATSLSASASWQVSAQTGDFSWSYPMRVPPSPGGVEPSVALSYDSQSVDGKTGSTNNQPSDVGEGWQVSAGGFIERSYASCSDDGVSTSGDLCWKTDNATLSMAGHSGVLVHDSGNVWRLRDDDGTRIERLTGASNGDANSLNPGEYWRLTTTDGTQYTFGQSTGSTQTVPVFGNTTGEPCHGASFATSACVLAYRWNLESIVDPNGNAEKFLYSMIANSYRQNNTTVVRYVRAAVLTEIDYGYRSGDAGLAPERVVFDNIARCKTTTGCTVSNPANWPDTPLDQYCAGAPCTGLVSPTFWSSYQTTRIHTQTLSGATYHDVDGWALTHSFPAPGDGTSPALWLSSITHTGYSGSTSITLPAVTFYGQTMQNRVWVVDGLAPLDKYRVYKIDSEAGSEITATYSAQQCTAAGVPSYHAESNALRCFPQWWTPANQPPQLDWFHKYVVTEVTQNPRTGGTGDTLADETFYDYSAGSPGWRYDDSPITPASERTWAMFAGYSKVTVRHGDPATPSRQQTSSYTYFQGMDGDRAAPAGGTKTASVTASDGSSVPDALWLAGQVRESTTSNGSGGPRVANTISSYWASPVTADDGTYTARLVAPSDSVTRTALSAGGDRVSETKTSYDSYGRPIAVDDLGDTATAGDDLCTRTSYASNTTGWLLDFPAEVSTVGKTCTSTPSLPGDAVSDTRSYYDSSTTLGAAPSKGNPTRTDTVDSYTGATPHWQTTTTITYDALGRATAVTDPRTGTNRTTTTAYTPTTGPVTQTVVTNPLGWATTTSYNPAWGVPSAVVDQNAHRTDASYDPLGRLTQVWLPDRLKSANPSSPSTAYAYTVSKTAPNAIKTTALIAGGGTVSSYALYDGLLRPRQTQAPSEGGGIMLTDTFYDTEGQVSATNNTYYATGSPSTALIVPTLAVPSWTQNTYDGAGRHTAQIAMTGGSTELWRTSSVYGGDHVDVTPPAGGTATSTWTDARGHTTRLMQYHAATPTGAADTTSYGYDHRGELTAMTGPTGQHWTWAFDALGRQTTAADPESGTTTTSYDPAGRVSSTTDNAGATLAYSYDTLDRKTGQYVDSTAGTKLASWTYDSLSKGQLTSSTRYVGSDAYTEAVGGYDAADRPTAQSVTIPPSAGALAGTYTSQLYYWAGGAPSAIAHPAEGGLPAEIIRYGYDSLGTPTGMGSDLGSYLGGVTYTHLGQIAQTNRYSGIANLFDTRSYDAGTGRLTEDLQQRESSTNAVIADDTYAYDHAGNITSDTNNAPAAGTDTQCFNYDYLQRLTQSWTPATAGCTAAPSSGTLGGPAPYWTSYSMDPAGNRTGLTQHATTSAGTDTTDTYTYPAGGFLTDGTGGPDALKQVTHTGATTSTDTYSYDANGRTTTRPGQQLAYNPDGRLASITLPGGAQQTRIYNADGTLLLQTDPTTGATLYLDDTEIHAAPGAATPADCTATRTYPDAGMTVAERDTTTGTTGSTLVFLDTNPQRTATATINTTDTVTRRYYDPYGNPRGATPTTWPSDHGFLNKPTDTPTNLTHLGARDYDPTTGRFTTLDPIAITGDPQQLNGYSYANDNPVGSSDPGGQCPKDVCGAGINEPTGTTNPNACLYSYCYSSAASGTAACMGHRCETSTRDSRHTSVARASAHVSVDTGSARGEALLGAFYQYSQSHGYQTGQQRGPAWAQAIRESYVWASFCATKGRSLCGLYLLTTLDALYQSTRVVTSGAGLGQLEIGTVTQGQATGELGVARTLDCTPIVETLRHYTTGDGAKGIAASENMIKTGETSGKIWLTPDVYRTGTEARSNLALETTPEGYYEIPVSRIGNLNGPGPVQSNGEQPGGGIEYTTTEPISVEWIPFVPFGGEGRE
ncbi:MAG: RHS repeat-associated core domain-containing protein [Jatrophihabitans sp.]